jgi:hypothetical protein
MTVVRLLSSRLKRDAVDDMTQRQTVSPFQFPLSHPRSKKGHIFLQTEKNMGFLDEGCVRLHFPTEILPRNMMSRSGKSFFDWFYSHLFPLHSKENEKCPYVPRALSEEEEARLINGVAVQRSVVDSRRLLPVSLNDFKFKKVYPTYVQLIKKHEFVMRVKCAIEAGISVEIVLPPSVTQFHSPLSSSPFFLDRTFSSTDSLPVEDMNIAGLLRESRTLDALCIVFASVFILGRESDWLKT